MIDLHHSDLLRSHSFKNSTNRQAYHLGFNFYIYSNFTQHCRKAETAMVDYNDTPFAIKTRMADNADLCLGRLRDKCTHKIFFIRCNCICMQVHGWKCANGIWYAGMPLAHWLFAIFCRITGNMTLCVCHPQA